MTQWYGIPLKKGDFSWRIFIFIDEALLNTFTYILEVVDARQLDFEIRPNYLGYDLLSVDIPEIRETLEILGLLSL